MYLRDIRYAAFICLFGRMSSMPFSRCMAGCEKRLTMPSLCVAITRAEETAPSARETLRKRLEARLDEYPLG